MRSWLCSCALTLAALVGPDAGHAQPVADSPVAVDPLFVLAAPRWQPAHRLTRSAGESRTSINFARSIAADARGGVHVVWREQAVDGPAVCYKHSPDGGVSWGPPARVSPCPWSEHSGNPSIAVSGDAVHVVWRDERTVPLMPPQIWYARSLDGGVSWDPERQLTFSPGAAAFCSIAAWGANVHVVFWDQREGIEEVYYVRSTDAGQTWTPPVRLSAGPHNSYTATIAVYGSNVYVAWTDTRHFPSDSTLEEEYFRRSTDNGNTWGPEQRLTMDPPDGPANSWAPSLVAQGSHVWIAWFDDRGNAPGDFDIYLDHSPDFGQTWTGNRRLTHAADGASFRPVIALHGQDMYLTWWDTRSGNEEVYVKHSPNLGAGWGPDVRLSAHPGASTFPGIAATVTGVHVVWTDNRDGNAELYYTRAAGAPIRAGNGRIAFSQGEEGAKQIFTMNPDGSDPQQLTFGGDNIFPAWSKDGTKLAFSSSLGGAYEIWTMNPDGSGASQVSQGAPGGSYVPDWSFDGTRIAYAYVSPAVGHPEVWVMNSDGSGAMRLTHTPVNPNGPTWSLLPTWEPGDARIYYASTADGDSQIWAMSADGPGQHQKTDGLGPDAPHANAPQFSRAGVLAFWAGFESQFGEVWRADFSHGVGPTRLTQTPDPMSSDNPVWSPDGSKIVFDSDRGGAPAIWIMNADGSGVQPWIPNVWGRVAWQPVFH